jgi:hypothetical protein
MKEIPHKPKPDWDLSHYSDEYLLAELKVRKEDQNKRENFLLYYTDDRPNQLICEKTDAGYYVLNGDWYFNATKKKDEYEVMSPYEGKNPKHIIKWKSVKVKDVKKVLSKGLIRYIPKNYFERNTYITEIGNVDNDIPF